MIAASTEEIRRQLEERARVKQSFFDELIGRILQFARRCAESLRNGRKIAGPKALDDVNCAFRLAASTFAPVLSLVYRPVVNLAASGKTIDDEQRTNPSARERRNHGNRNSGR
jgi:hypothetical protein